MMERTFLKERVKKREFEELQEENRLKELQNRPGQNLIIGTAPAPEK